VNSKGGLVAADSSSLRFGMFFWLFHFLISALLLMTHLSNVFNRAEGRDKVKGFLRVSYLAFRASYELEIASSEKMCKVFRDRVLNVVVLLPKKDDIQAFTISYHRLSVKKRASWWLCLLVSFIISIAFTTTKKHSIISYTRSVLYILV